MNEDNSRKGLDFIEAFALILITLKLCGVIAWGWVWVLAPLWIPAVIFVGITVFALVVKKVVQRDGE